MSSGEKAKPPATYEERNPFDISRRSEKDIAAEIAQRMAAWKQARGRSYATPSTVPSGEAKLPPVSAPVQPARLPKSGGHAAPAPQPQTGAATVPQPRRAEAAAEPAHKPVQPTARAPLFATVSAVRRAMPAAPSLKRPTPPVDAPVATAGNEAVEIVAPKTETVETAAAQSAAPAHVEAVTERADIEKVDATNGVAETPAMADGDAHVDGQRQDDSPSSDAPAMPAIEAHDLPSIHAAAMPEIEIAAPDTEARDSEVERPDLDAPMMEMREPDPAPEIDTPVAESERIESTAPVIPSIEVLEAATRRIEGRERKEPIFAAPETPPIDAREVEAPEAAPAREARDVETDPVQEHEIAAPVAGSERIELTAPAIPSIKELEAVTRRIEGRERKEPTFDEPTAERPAVEDATAMPVAATSVAATSVAPGPLAAEQPGKAVRAVPLPSIETRIEKRRIDSLRADPRMAGRPPIFPHIDPEEWPPERIGERDIPPVVAARAQRQPHGGTGWAIGLGAILLIAGITAPAAIWQGRQQVPADQDQLVMLPMPASPSTPETNPATQATLPDASQPEAPQPEAPQPEAPQPEMMRPDMTPPPATAAEAPSAPPPPDVAEPAPQEQTTLGAVQSGGELNEAPISMPPAPVLDLASKPRVQFPQAPSDVAPGEVPFPPAARPFVPEQETATPFRRAQAGASVPVNSTALPAGTQVDVQSASMGASMSASIALKPNLMGQLKPKATSVQAARPAASAPQKIVRKPKPFLQQSPDQMFQTLINTLSAGQPPNPATKPTPPSTRK